MFAIMFATSGMAIQQFARTPQMQTTVTKGDTVILECVIANIGGKCSWEKDGLPVGLYPDKYTWRTNGDNGDWRTHGVDGDCSLVIHDASPAYDDGEWQCQVSAGNIAEADILISNPASLIVIQPPNEVSIGQDNLCESSSSNPPSELELLFDGIKVEAELIQEDIGLDDGSWRSSVDISGVLKKENHGRRLQCRAKHKLSNTTLTTSKLLNIPFQPEIRSVTADKEYYLQNETAVLQCEVISNPPALVVWRHLPSLAIVGTGSALVIENMEDGDKAYECIAENEVGRTVSDPVAVPLAHAPRIVDIDNETKVVQTGDDLTISCFASSIPEASCRWFHKTLSGDIKIVSNNSLLNINNLEFENSGEYLCEASNMIGITLGNVVTVSVEGKPDIRSKTETNFTITEGQTFDFTVDFCSNPTSEIVWMKNGKEFFREIIDKTEQICSEARLQFADIDNTKSGNYQVVITNKYGSDSYQFSLNVDSIQDKILSNDELIGICVGSGAVLTLLICLGVLIARSVRKKKIKAVESLGTNSQTDDCDVENPSVTQLGSKEELIVSKNLSSTSVHPPPLYTQLSFPKSSNCGSMRKKKEDHYKHLMNIYSETIKQNISSSNNDVFVKSNIYL